MLFSLRNCVKDLIMLLFIDTIIYTVYILKLSRIIFLSGAKLLF
jgi:hypothetical protein